jgi:pimeloyl-ACP methyl ester carboxylesterase
MSLFSRRHFSDLRGVVRLAVDATVGVTNMVEKVHHTIQLAHPPVGSSRASKTSGMTGLVYRTIRGTTRLVGSGLDKGLAPLSTLMPESTSPAIRDDFVSVINGVYGDQLITDNNPLAISMSIRSQGISLDLENPGETFAVNGETGPTGKVMLFVHGLGLNDNHWTRDGHNHAEALATRLGYTPLYLRYNTGMPIASNGRALARILEGLLKVWPEPVDELVIAGHSMGGLVTRSAAHHGALADQTWIRHLKRMIFIGSPHHGAPLEKGSNWLDYALDLSPYAAPFTGIAKTRSKGITDLRHGNITDQDRECVPLPSDVECYAVAATLGKSRSKLGEKLIGDGLVPIDSALGQSKDPERTLSFEEDHQWLGFETGHIEMLGSAELYEQLHEWLK